VLADELRRLKAEGQSGVYLDDRTWAWLNGVEEGAEAAQPERTTSTTRAPEARARDEGSAQPSGASQRESGGASLEEYFARSARETASASPPARAPAGASGETPSGIDPVPEPPELTLPEGDKQEQWEWLRERVLGDPVCRKHSKPGCQVVFGVGSLGADLFFCGEAPGEDEEKQGEPFVGRAGQLLDKIIAAMGLARESVYIGNIMNWRPETGKAYGNRPPSLREMAYCLPFLRGQVAIVRPRVIVALGNTAVTGFLGEDPKRTMGRVRGRVFDFEGTPLVPTYHPSYLLRNGSNREKRKVWEDMMVAMEQAGITPTEKQRGYFL
jgi:DNA polymerase